MEHAIGTRITLANGKVVEVVEAPSESCKGCAGTNMRNCLLTLGCCSYWQRTDHKHIIYKEIKDTKQL